MGDERPNHVGRCKTPRRGFLAAAGTGIVSGITFACVRRVEGTACPEKQILQRGDKVQMNCTREDVIQRAYQLGFEYEKKHGGCAQCTVAALQDAVPLVPCDQGMFRAASCLDGGATPVEVQNCGAFTGAGIVIGYLTGRTRDQESFRGGAGFSHELLHRVYERFKEQYGTVLCRDVRKGAEGNCPEVVGRAAKWVAEVLVEEFCRKPGEEERQET